MEHWAKLLETGDRIIATIRHPYNGELNLVNVPAVVFENIVDLRKVKVMYAGSFYEVDYNDLKIHNPRAMEIYISLN